MSLLNEETIRPYMNAARRSIQSARHNFNNGFYNTATNRAYYAFFYAASALLLTSDISRSKHGGIISAFRQYFVKPGLIDVQYSRTYGEAFNTRQVTDYDTTTIAHEWPNQEIIDDAERFVECITIFLKGMGYS